MKGLDEWITREQDTPPPCKDCELPFCTDAILTPCERLHSFYTAQAEELKRIEGVKEVSELICYPINDVFSKGYIILSDFKINGINTVALVLVSEEGLTIYRHRRTQTVANIMGAIPNNKKLPVNYQIFDIEV